MLRFSFARFSSFAFCRTLLCLITLAVGCRLFCFAFFFVCTVFAFISFYRPLGVFPFGSFIFGFFGFFVIVLLRLCTPGLFVSFVSFAIVSVAFAFSARFVQSLAFFIYGLCYFSWRLVYLGSARLALRGPRVVGLFVLVFVALSRALFSNCRFPSCFQYSHV